MKGFWVYGLFDPRTGALRYVGKTTHGMTRIRGHWTPSGLKVNTKKAAWLKSLISQGLRPEIDVLETAATDEELKLIETFWIASLRACGAELLNHTDGGEGHLGARHSVESRAKISRAGLGRKHSEQTKKNMSDAHLRLRRGRKIVDSLGREYSSLTEAANVLGVDISNIGNVLSGKQKTTCGLTFRYV